MIREEYTARSVFFPDHMIRVTCYVIRGNYPGKSRICTGMGTGAAVARELLRFFASGAHELKAREVGSRLMCSTREKP